MMTWGLTLYVASVLVGLFFTLGLNFVMDHKNRVNGRAVQTYTLNVMARLARSGSVQKDQCADGADHTPRDSGS